MLCSSSLLVISPRLLCHLHLMEFFTWTVSWLKTAYRRGNSIHPWGMPRFRVTGCKHDTQGTFHVDQSHPFTMAKVSETGLWSFRLLTCFCSGMGSVVLDLRQEGMIASVRLRLKIFLNTSALHMPQVHVLGHRQALMLSSFWLQCTPCFPSVRSQLQVIRLQLSCVSSASVKMSKEHG